MKVSHGVAVLAAVFLASSPAAARASETSEPCAWTVEPELFPLTGYEFSPRYFGKSVALTGTHALVGAPGLDAVSGDAHLFRRVDGAWELEALLQGETAPVEDGFGRSVALIEGWALVGAPRENAGAGAAYLYREVEPGIWDQVAVLHASESWSWWVDPDDEDGDWDHDWDSDWDGDDDFELEDWLPDPRFGEALALSPERVVVGAPGIGRAYVFEPGPTGWEETAVLSRLFGGQEFGASLSMDAGRLAVGAPGSGRAYLYGSDPAGSWTELAALDGGGSWKSQKKNRFGTSVSLLGDRIAVGAPHANGKRGEVQVFGVYAGVWEHSATLVSSAAEKKSYFGQVVTQTPGAVLAAAPAEGESKGAVYLFEPLGESWKLAQEFRPDPDSENVNFGNAVGLAGQTVMINVGLEEHPVFKYAGKVRVWSANAQASCTRLSAFPGWISVADGGSQKLLLESPATTFQPYLLLGSMGAPSLGLLLGDIALPLEPDAYFHATLLDPASTPLGVGYGLLDSEGRAGATFDLAPGLYPGAAGLTLHHAFLVLDPWHAPVAASNAVSLALVP